MGIKKKKQGPQPIYRERWQELAKDPDRLSEARAEYQAVNRNTSLVDAHRAIMDFRRRNNLATTFAGKAPPIPKWR